MDYNHWTRSVNPRKSTQFRYVNSDGYFIYSIAAFASYVNPAFSF